MKKSKNDRTMLTFIMMISIFICALMMILDMCVSGPSWFWVASTDGKITMDWNYAAIYFVFMIIALSAWVVRTVKYTHPMYKDKNQLPSIVCECLVVMGILFAIIALFLPINTPATTYADPFDYANPSIIAHAIMSWLGMPVAMFASVARLVIER